jgi:AcrR family transcriptional regulator
MSRLASPELAERRRRQILDAAVDCFRRRGFHQTSMQEICNEAGISAGALYRYFDSKADIIAAIAADGRHDASVGFEAANASVVDALCAVARSFFAKIADGDGALVAEVLAEAARDPALARNLVEVDAQYVAACAQAIRVGQQNGEVDPDLVPAVAAHTLFAAIEGIGLRAALLGRIEMDAVSAQFRALAERYLALRA